MTIRQRAYATSWSGAPGGRHGRQQASDPLSVQIPPDHSPFALPALRADVAGASTRQFRCVVPFRPPIVDRAGSADQEMLRLVVFRRMSTMVASVMLDQRFRLNVAGDVVPELLLMPRDARGGHRPPARARHACRSRPRLRPASRRHRPALFPASHGLVTPVPGDRSHSLRHLGSTCALGRRGSTLGTGWQRDSTRACRCARPSDAWHGVLAGRVR